MTLAVEQLLFKKHVTPTHISIICTEHAGSIRPIGSVEADALFSGEIHDILGLVTDTRVWWIARCLVQEAYRNHKIGTQLLMALKESVADDWIVVAPGGYGADPTMQKRFYTNNGFVEVGDSGLLVRRMFTEVL